MFHCPISLTSVLETEAIQPNRTTYSKILCMSIRFYILPSSKMLIYRFIECLVELSAVLMEQITAYFLYLSSYSLEEDYHILKHSDS